MSQKPSHDAAGPDAEALNAAIRELWARARSEARPLSADEHRIYEALVVAWAATQRGDVARAA
ncbi:hypothetical protein [Streptomyces sp. SP18CS02]|uniref:hypothetical protein n=1 Tax=Streptomyces sp. SP18CS02 TaxID=3002531 RepID=UPI002E78FF40|nr:hypothetical protein [Streptomyces sp. SP18CS02]MEE1753818.1 hypothetical protein [Streptomyces sp. SP18CS02]